MSRRGRRASSNPQPSMQPAPVDSHLGGEWESESPTGLKVCSLRLDSTHLIHTGLNSGWSVVEVEAYFADCASELIRPRPGQMLPPSDLPAELSGWGEAIRFAQDEFWGATEPQGTTVAFQLGKELWVLTRGNHRVDIHCVGSSDKPEKFPQPVWGGKIWRLEPQKSWQIRVSTADGSATFWKFGWLSATAPEDADEHVEAAPIPVEAATAPIEAAPIPVEAATAPIEAAPIPVEASAAPIEAAPIPVEASAASVEAPSDPVEEMPEKVMAPEPAMEEIENSLAVSKSERPTGPRPIFSSPPPVTHSTDTWVKLVDLVQRADFSFLLSWLPTPLRRIIQRNLVPAFGILGFITLVVLTSVLVPRDQAGGWWSWVTDVAAARYRTEVSSRPSGGAILVDGQSTGLTTPAQVVLSDGSHTIEVSFEKYGSESVSVTGGRGDRLAAEIELLGSLVVGNVDSTVVLYARLDGEPIGELPAFLDSVPVGRRQITFQGQDVRPWTEEIDIVVGGSTQIVARPERVPEFGAVMARAYQVSSNGLKEVNGAAIYLDGVRVGWTPKRLEVRRGYHTVRLSTADETSPVQLLRVHGGGELYATAEFGKSPEPEVIVQAPEETKLEEAPPVIHASLAGNMPIRIRQMKLYWREEGDDFARVAMDLSTGNLGVTGSYTVPLNGFEGWGWLEYFVLIESDQGEEFVSEIHRIRVIP